jgi:hypothetical protein
VLERTNYYHGHIYKIDAGKVKQNFRTATPEAWSKMLDFIGLGGHVGRIVEYRKLFRGAWIPNIYCPDFTKSDHFETCYVVKFAEINVNVDSEFLRVGY